MTTLGRSRRRTNSVLRPFIALFLVSLLILLFRSASVVQAMAVAGTQALVPVQRVLAETGVTTNRFFQAIGELEKLRADNATLRASIRTRRSPRRSSRATPAASSRPSSSAPAPIRA